MAKRPIVPFAVLILITAASLGVLAANPLSFDMDEGSFMPDNEMTRASAIISASFTSSASVMSMVDGRTTGGDIFTKDMFLSILQYEQMLYDLEYTGADGSTENPYNMMAGFRIVSPVSAVASTFTGPELLSADDAAIKKRAFDVFTGAFPILGGGEIYLSLLTNDFVIDPVAETVTASGCIISMMITDAGVELIQDGELGFERDVIGAAKAFNSVFLNNPRVIAVGMETMMKDIGSMAQDDISMLLPIALAVIFILLFLLYRDVPDTLVALLGLLIAIVWTFGISTVMGIGMSTIAIAVPILILALGIDYSLHLVFRYREERAARNEPKKAIGITMGSVGQALVLATATTAIAFLSYQTSALDALADFGLMCAIGIVCAFGAMMLLVPTTQVLRDRRAAKKGKDPDEAKRYKKEADPSKDTLGKVAGVGGAIAAKRPLAVLGVIALIVAMCGYSATNISYDFDMYEFIPSGTEAHDTIVYLSDNFAATTATTSVLIFGDPWNIDVIRAIEQSLYNMSGIPIRGVSYHGVGPPDSEYIGTALKSIYDMLASTPSLAPLYAVYHALYIASFDPTTGLLQPWATQPALKVLQSFIESIPDFAPLILSVVGEHNGAPITRIILKMTSDGGGSNEAILEMRDAVVAACQPLTDMGIKIVVTGQFVILAATMIEMNKSQMSALLITIALVMLILTLVMMYTHRSVFLGVMATIPTIISVIMVWGTMAALHMPLNVMTLTIASLAVGLGVTYGIHISNRYATDLRSGSMSAEDTIRKTMRETGKGVFAAALTTIAGFGVMGFSKILPLYQFGIITALAILFGYIGSIFVLPALLVLWGRYVRKKQAEPKDGHPEWNSLRDGWPEPLPKRPRMEHPEWDPLHEGWPEPRPKRPPSEK